jgi:UDP-N-acetylmuramoyl-tripeptide--D-alanyl-D-alanine ligase
VAVYPATEALMRPHVGGLANAKTFGPKGSGATVTYDDVKPGPTGLTMRLFLTGVTPTNGVATHVPLIGRHNASNASAAACVALELDVGEGSILDGLAAVKPAKHRAQLVQLGDRTILDDCYNAAPASMRAALDALVEVTPPDAQKIAVLGDMLELGPESAQLHAEVGRYAATRVDQLVTLGEAARAIDDGARAQLTDERVFHAADPRAAAERVRAVSRPGDVILVKASRGMRLERVIDALAEKI